MKVDRDSSRKEESIPGLPPKMPTWKKVGITLLVLLVLSTLGAAATVVSVVEHYSQDLPDVAELEKNYAPPQVTRVYARDQTLLANIFSERRTVVPFSRVPDHVKSAFLAAEDAGFFEHEGLDYLGLIRALVVNLRSGRVRQGGSTITQQVVKNVLLSQERSYQRKIRETILAYRIEKFLSKEQILGMYLNHIYLGHGRYGVEEAGRFYFGKHVEDLNVAEAALLAGVVASPENYSPRKSETKAKARRSYVLGQMLQKGFMTQEVYDAALSLPIRLAPVSETESDIAPEMVGHANRMLKQLAPETYKKGGYSVYTTIDPELQVRARAALQKGLDDYLVRQRLKPPFTLKERKLWGKVFEGMPRQHGIYVGQVVDRDDKTGNVTVKVGDVIGTLSLFNEPRYNPKNILPTEFVGPDAALRVRVLDPPEAGALPSSLRLRLELGPQGALVAIDPKTWEVLAAVGSYEALPGGLDRSVQTKRQPGSTFKPIVYSFGLSTHQITAASQFEFESKDKNLPEGQVPHMDHLSLRQGIATSDNRVALSVLRTVGAVQAVQWAQSLGFRSHLAGTESLMLGAYEVTVAEMAQAYSVFASGGVAQEIRFISKIESGAGELRLPPRPPERRVMDPSVAYVMTSLLSSVIENGTGRSARSLGRPLAGKTGTTNKAKDAWFVGYSTDLVAAVWVGFDDALPLGWGESGAKSALPIWTAFMKEALKDKPSTDFPRPPEVSEIDIDPATGLLARYGQEDSVREVFILGTEPRETAPEPAPEAPPEQDPTDPQSSETDAAASSDTEQSGSQDNQHVDGDLTAPWPDQAKDRVLPPLPEDAPPF